MTHPLTHTLYHSIEGAGLCLVHANVPTSPLPQAVDGGHNHAKVVTPEEVIRAALAASRRLTSASEEEALTNNVTCAQLFAGLLRGFTTHLHHQQQQLLLVQSSSSSTSEGVAEIVDASTLNHIKATLASVEQLCVDYFVEKVEKLSDDYFDDWAEAVYFAMSCGCFHARYPQYTTLIPTQLLKLRLTHPNHRDTSTLLTPCACLDDGWIMDNANMPSPP